MTTDLPYKVYPEKRKRGWVLIHLTGISRSGTAKEIWKPSLIKPREPYYFGTQEEARQFARKVTGDPHI